MKQVFFIFFLGFTMTLFSQQIDYNEQKSFVASGYDVVAYFSKTAVKGAAKFEYKYDGAHYKFSTQKNLEMFKENPKKYVPQYGGWCAYAMAVKGEKVTVNPKTFEIRNNRLYLFYNSWGTNTLESWLIETPLKLIPKADESWAKVKFKS